MAIIFSARGNVLSARDRAVLVIISLILALSVVASLEALHTWASERRVMNENVLDFSRRGLVRRRTAEEYPWSQWTELEKLFYYKNLNLPDEDIPPEYRARRSIMLDPEFDPWILEERKKLSKNRAKMLRDSPAAAQDWVWYTISKLILPLHYPSFDWGKYGPGAYDDWSDPSDESDGHWVV